MNRAILLFFILISTNLFSQPNTPLFTKSFYYDVDNYSLTSESMVVLAEFVEEIKLNPIEIIEIIGYIEKAGSPVYNQIRSKKRMSSIKTAIDTNLVVHQYNPTNINYPPAFLYSYTDGYNWRRVDIVYKILPKKLILPITQYSNPNEVIEDKVNPIKEIKPEEKDRITITTNTEDKVNLDEKAKIEEKLKLIEIEKNKNNTVELDEKQKDLNTKFKPEETGQISIIGKSQDQIDHLVIREKSASSNGSRKSNHPDVGVRLSKINVADMDNSIILINLNIQFEGDAPIVNKSSIQEIDELVDFLKKNNAIDAFIRGHVCCGDQLPLSEKRANTIYKELIRRGINPDRLRYKGFSNTILAVNPEITDLDRSKNRRVDIIFSKNSTRSNEPVNLTQEVSKIDSSQNIKKGIFSNESKIAIEVDGNSTLEFVTTGVSQDQIDMMLVREKPSSKSSSKNENVDMGTKLSRINIENLNKSVVLVIMGLEFEDIDPILTETSIKEMNDLFNFLNENKQIQAFIRGHVCCGDNLKLSKKRAKYVWGELIKRGIDPSRLRYQGFSNSLLLVNPERNEADRAKNRRVDIIFSVK